MLDEIELCILMFVCELRNFLLNSPISVCLIPVTLAVVFVNFIHHATDNLHGNNSMNSRRWFVIDKWCYFIEVFLLSFI